MKKRSTRLLALLLSVMMVLSSLPLTAFAAEEASALDAALADESTEVHFLTMTSTGGGWTSVTDKNAVSLQLFALVDPSAEVSSTSALTPAASIVDGASYAIRSKAYDGNAWSIMHCGATWAYTNQCGSSSVPTTLGNCAAAHLLTFAEQADGTYTIRSANGYLTQTPTDPKPVLPNASGTARDEFDLTDDASKAAKFGVTAAGTAGSYYIWWETREQTEPEPAPEPGEGQMWAYVGFSGKWGLSAEAYTTKLYKLDGESGATGTPVSGELQEGYYLIGALTVGDTKGPRLMYDHASTTGKIDQWSYTQGETVTVPKNETRFQLSKTEDGGWTIKGVTSGKFLNVSGVTLNTYNQLPMGDESAATTFVIKAVDDGYTIAAIVSDPEYVEPSVDPEPKFPTAGTGKTIVYQKVTDASSLLTDGTLYAFVDDTPPNATSKPRVLYHASGSGRTDQLEVTVGETLTIASGFAKERQLWTLVETTGGYKLRSWDDGQYLTASANASTPKQLGVDTTGSVFTVEASENGKFYVRSGGKYLEFNGDGGDGWKMVDTASELLIYTPTLVAISGEQAQTEFKGTADKPMSQESTGTRSFRIPALTTLSNGWIVAASDIRWRTTADSPQNLDTIVSVSKDGGATWDWEVVNYWADMATTATDARSASFIDPSVVQAADGTIHMIVDACPAYTGLAANNQIGAACTGFDSQGRMLVAKGTADANAPMSTPI